ncbi:hypothetical protein RvY_00168 [Ramazzottius varieornatus]|uniref:Cilia- and flagella-associated protein 206 n=1 Tax=Ramazzottius varieornatus TaxID=947166 RepID=A0A1D1UBS7_RAMVA|nr:hypothetical protein RvY_00168 [Ramazzottius varieornatus]
MSGEDEAHAEVAAGNVLPLWVIVDGITKYCTRNGIAMSKPLAEHLVLQAQTVALVNSVVANSVVANSVEETKLATLTKDNLQTLTEACIKKFQNEPFAIAAAELQIYLDVSFPTRECFLNELRHQQDKDCYVLLDDILNTTVASKWELEQLTKKIVTYVIVRSFLGDLKDIAVFKDCAAALSSIWPEGTVNRFSNLSREKKKIELQDYLYLSSGVRLFNREKQQGGVGISDGN